MDSTIQLVKVLKHAGATDEVVVRTLLMLDSAPRLDVAPEARAAEQAPKTLLPAAVARRGFAQVKFSPAPGKTSNVVVPVELMQRLVRAHGGVAAAYERVRELAQARPWTGRGRSGQICDELLRELPPAA